MARRYMKTIRRASRASGRKRRKLIRRAGKIRKRIVRGNKRKRKNLKCKNLSERIRGSKPGRKALARYRKFWGLDAPLHLEVMGRGKGMRYLVGMGHAPVMVLSDSPEKGGKIRRIRGRFTVATDSAGKRLFLLRRNAKGNIGTRKKFVGWAPETHYVPTREMEKAGTFKKGAYWVHKHDDERGRWPKVYQDASGNFLYGPGTYRVGEWIRR